MVDAAVRSAETRQRILIADVLTDDTEHHNHRTRGV